MEIIITTGKKEFYNTDGQKAASEWVREEIKKHKKANEVLLPHMGSALNINSKDHIRAVQGHLGFMVNLSNNIYYNRNGVCIGSSIMTQGNAVCGFSIIPENFHKVTTLMTARKCYDGQYENWINDKDEYLSPNEDHPKWKQFVADSLVYSLFNNSSQQSSLRQVDYKGKKWDIKNEFFWLKRD